MFFFFPAQLLGFRLGLSDFYLTKNSSQKRGQEEKIKWRKQNSQKGHKVRFSTFHVAVFALPLEKWFRKNPWTRKNLSPPLVTLGVLAIGVRDVLEILWPTHLLHIPKSLGEHQKQDLLGITTCKHVTSINLSSLNIDFS